VGNDTSKNSFIGATIERKAGLLFVLLSFSVAILSGCAALPERKPMSAELQEVAIIPGIPRARDWGDARPAHYEEWMSLSKQEIRERYPESFGKPHNYLAISGGGPKGAFGAGLLNGWTDSGTRPQFTIVTGVSTGSILAPFAFLGSEYDPVIKEFYTTLSTKDLIEQRSLIDVLRKDAVADTTLLKKKIAEYITDDLVANIAAESAKGRELFIGTTNLDAARPVSWDITAIAASGAPNATQLIRDIILASAAIPAAFPPVLFKVEANGQLYDELHVDGSVSSNVFVYPIGIDWAKVLEKMEVTTKPNLYVLRNGYLLDEWTAVERNTLNIAGYSMSTLMTYVTYGDFHRIYLATQRDGLDFNFINIPADFEDTSSELFDPVWMTELYKLGYKMAIDGIDWQKTPPGYDTNDGEQ